MLPPMSIRLFIAFVVGCGGTPVDVKEPQPEPCPADSCLDATLADTSIAAFAERDGLCLSYTLDNDEPLFVNSVTAYNDGAFHHSNWFWVPEDQWDLPDGEWDCSDNDFTELAGALSGGVLFAQSTQVLEETQQFLPGVAIRVGKRARIIAAAHLLNPTDERVDTSMRFRLGLLDEESVEVRLAPIRITYFDLDIPPGTDTDHGSRCDLADRYESVGGQPYDMKLHYVLSHFHGLGTGFELSVAGGPNDGQVLFEQRDAYGHQLGKTFEEPLDLTGSDGLNFSCFHTNKTDETVGWGIGDQEMCVMLGFVDSTTMFDMSVNETVEMGEDGDVLTRSGECDILAVPFDFVD